MLCLAHSPHRGFVNDDDALSAATLLVPDAGALRHLQFADAGYALVSGSVAMAGTGAELLENADVGRLFLGVR
jgi:branched-chain amino acid transport system ATP-binding protein